MLSTKKLKIRTLIMHALIPIGMRHGGIFLGLLSPFCLRFSNESVYASPFAGNGNPAFIGLIILSGQVALVRSILLREYKVKQVLHFCGLVLLWLSIVFFFYFFREDTYTHISIISCLPFFVCTILFFAGRFFMRPGKWTDEGL